MTTPAGQPPSPQELQLRLDRAIALMNAGDARRAADIALPLLRFGPKHPDLLNLVGTALLRLGDAEGARAMLQRAMETGHAEPVVRVRLARAQHRCGDHEAASASFERAISELPDNDEARRSYIAMLVDLRRFDDAQDQLGPMLDEHGFPRTHKGAAAMALLAEHTGSEARAAAAIEHFIGHATLTPLERAALHGFLGRLKERTGDFAGAFAAFAEMNEIDRDGAYDPAVHSGRVDRLIKAWTERGVSGPAEGDPGGADKVFIVGMPRSGTTLVEQMLAAHPSVTARGERNEVPNIAAALDDESRDRRYQALALHPDRINDEFIANARRFYLDPIPEGSGITTDKMPANAVHMPMLRVLFPACRVIVCRRDPLNTCLSNFTQRFTGIHSHTTDLRWLASYARDHQRLLDAWIGGSVDVPRHTVVRYEDAVADPEGTARTLCSFLGIEFDASMARPHEVERVAFTASRAQVQRPVHTRSVDRAARFGDLLDPLRDALNPA